MSIAISSSSSQGAEAYARELDAKVVLHKYHATASRFPTREAFNLFVRWLVSHDYRYRLINSVASEVSFSLKPASVALRNMQEDEFELGRIS